MGLLSLAIAIIPVVLIGKYIYSKDKEKEPGKLIKKLIVGGIFSCLLVLVVSAVINIFTPIFNTDLGALSKAETIVYVFINVALVEEVCKLIFLYKYTYNCAEFDYSFDMIVYAVYISLGFAVFENIFYVYSYGISAGILRAFTAVPMHASFGVFMGIFLSKAKQCQLFNKTGVFFNTLLAMAIPTLLHGIYDYAATVSSTFIFILIDVIIIASSIVFVNIKRKQDKKIQYKYRYCIYCKAPVVGKYCVQCGKENV